MTKRVFTAMWLILSLVLAGCAREEITAENIVSKMQETQRNTTDLHAVVQVDFTSPEETGSLKGEFWTRKTGTKDEAGNEISAVRAKLLESSIGDVAGTEAVFDGDKGWLYSPKDNTAYVGTKAEIEANKPERDTNGPADQTQMLLQLQEFVQKGLAAFNIEILGEEPIAGHNAYKLKITPKSDAQAQLQLPIELLVEITLWVDSERYLPLKLVVDAKDMGKVEVTAQTLDTNTNLDPAIFAAQPPAGAKTVNVADMLKEMEKTEASPTTLEDAKAKAGFPVLSATEAAGAALTNVQLITLPRGATVVQTFSGAGVEWSLVQSQGDDKADRAQGGAAVDVRGVKGTLIEGKGNVGTLLIWEENGVTVVLAGNISADQAQKIAAGLK